MFFHGINFKYITQQYPYFNPDSQVSHKSETQLADRKHLIEQFGFEPIHLLESTSNYSVTTCLRECFQFGNVVFAFLKLKMPFWQISLHEIAICGLDVRDCRYIFVQEDYLKEKLIKFFPDKQMIIYTRI
jgi:hypothetical protein